MTIAAPNTLLLPAERAELERAVHALEHQSFASRLAELTGQPVSRLFAAMPTFVSRRLDRVVENAVLKSLEVAISSMEGEVPDEPPSSWVPRVIAGVTGGLGGLFGAFSLPVELPLTTTVLLRSIAEIAQSHGEDLKQLPSRLACLEVFALGARGPRENNILTYYATRALLSGLTRDVAGLGVALGTAEVTTTLAARIAASISSRFGPAVAERLAATAVPIAGLVSGAAINVLFMEHYQQLAHAHFTIRRLERQYGEAEIKTLYSRMAGTERRH